MNLKALLISLVFYTLLCITRGQVFAQKTLSSSIPENEAFDPAKERDELPGQTMGQKLESSLYWTVSEEKRRFPNMHRIFPSTKVSTGDHIFKLKEGKTIQPAWLDKTTLASYMKDNQVEGVLVLKDDKIRLEAYQDGFNQNTLWTSFSVAKSVSSILLGIALKDGYLKMDDSLSKYIPVLKREDYGKVTVKQLLTMTSGIDWNEDYADHNSDVARMNLLACENDEPHTLTYMKSLKSIHLPGTFWNYSTGETDLLGILIQKATKQTLSEYLSEKIWKTWGMEHTAYWLADECSGLNTGGHGISASLRDYARIGTLMLHHGKQKKLDLFTSEWLDKATSSLYATDKEKGGYGYLWWVNPNGSYIAAGIFGQMLYVNPRKNLVIAQYAAWPKATSEELSQKRTEFIEAVERVAK